MSDPTDTAPSGALVAADRPKHPGGRPTNYRPEYCEAAIEMGRLGLSECEIGAALDSPKSTLRGWRKANPEFDEAMAFAKMLEQAWFERRARENLSNRDFNGPLWAKMMAGRFHEDYRDNSRIELTGKNGGPVEHRTVYDISDAELAAIAAGSREDPADAPSG